MIEINRKHEKNIIEIIKEKKLMRFDHVFGYYTGCSRSTAYNHNLDKLDSIKEVLEENRVKGVNYLMQQWISGNNPTLQIAAMRLICTPEEHRKLNQQYMESKNEHTVNTIRAADLLSEFEKQINSEGTE